MSDAGPTTHRKGHPGFFAVTAAVVLTLGLAVYAASLLRDNELRQARAEFERLGAHIAGHLEHEMTVSLELVRLTANIFNETERISRASFSGFAQGAMSGQTSLRALEFVPRIFEEDRKSFEAAVRREGFPAFSITARSPDGTFIAAPPSPEHYPVLYAEPFAGNEALLGFDQASDPVRREALEEAVKTGATVISARVRPMHSRNHGWAILVAQPLLPKAAQARSPEERSERLMGFALGVFEVETLLHYAMKDLPDQAVNVTLTDLTAEPGQDILYERTAVSTAPWSLLPQPELTTVVPILTGQRHWQLRCVSTPGFLAGRLTWRPGLAILAGLAIAALLAIAMIKSLRLLALSEARTKEQAQAKLQALEGERKLQTILEGIQAATFAIDARSLAIQDINHVAEELFAISKAQWTGRPSGELLGSNLTPLGPAGQPEAHGGQAASGHLSGEYLLIRPDGKRIPLSRVTLPAVSGGADCVFEVFFDISAKKAMERQLGLAQKLESIGQLSSGIAHEINTPIQYVAGNLGFLQEAFRDVSDMIAKSRELVRSCPCEDSIGPQLDALMQDARYGMLAAEIPDSITDSIAGVERVADIVGAMKRFSHPDTENRRLVDIAKAIEATLAISRNEWKYNARVHTEIAPDLPLLLCSPGDVNQALLNVVVNAAHAITEKFESAGGQGLITVRALVRGGFMEISVADNGTGIPGENLDKVFDPFFTTKEVGRGTGQGLAIVHSVVQRHAGNIRIDSEPGQGTRITLCFPLAKESA